MPTKKSDKQEQNAFDIQKLMQNSDSYKSLIYGIVTVVVLFIVIALGVRTLSQNRAEVDDQAAMTDEVKDVLTSGYTVQEGETLWSIAEKSYGDGYAWVEIAKANNITDSNSLEKGQKLIIPKITPTKSQAMAQVSPTAAPTEVVVPTATPTAVSTPTPVVTNAPVAQAGTEKGMEDVQVMQKITGTTYTVVYGDNLWDIAVRAYGDGYRWVEIAKNNNLTNPNLIFSGNVLKLAR